MASAWAGVLVLAGLGVAAEPSAPAAPLAAHPAATPVAHPASLMVEETHDRWGGGPAALPATIPLAGARWGTDIGWPQCGHTLPDIAVDLTLIQVTAGSPGTVSPCLAEQAAWARSVGSVVNAYVVPGSPSSADLAAADPGGGTCHGNRSCLLRRAGAADAAHAMAGADAAGLQARGWWLDVEDVAARTLWGTDTVANVQVLIGWRDALRHAGRQVGVYSTPGYWRQVAGHWPADLPQWRAVGLAGVGAAERACGHPFTSGPVLLAQWLTGPLDGNLLCPGRDALAATFFGSFTRAHSAGVPDLLVIPVPHPDIEAAQRAQAVLEAEQAKRDQQARAAAAAAAAKKQRAATRAGAEPAPAPPAEPPSRPAPTRPAPTRPAPTRPAPAPPTGPAPAPTPPPTEPTPTPSPTEPAPVSPEPTPTVSAGE